MPLWKPQVRLNSLNLQTHFMGYAVLQFAKSKAATFQLTQHIERINNAGIKRKISDKQVRAICIILSGSHDDMNRIETGGQMKNWCNDSLKWLDETFG